MTNPVESFTLTLIVSCTARNSVVQVSDRRLTMPDGTVVEEGANKALCLWCRNAHVALGYAGLAEIDRRPTGRWLSDTLLTLESHTRTLAEIGAALCDRLTDAFRLITASNKQLTVVLTGYLDGTAFWGALSNHMGPTGEDLPAPLDSFTPFAVPTPVANARKAFLAVSGELRAVPRALDRRIKERQNGLYAQSPERTADELVSFIRISAKTSRYGTYVGQDCTAIIVLPNGRFRCRAYPVKATPVNFLPSVVAGPLALDNLTIDLSSGRGKKGST